MAKEQLPEEKQVIEGLVGESPEEEWREKLPAGIKLEMVDLFKGSDGLWHWHLRPEYIKDKKESTKYQKIREIWPYGF